MEQWAGLAPVPLGVHIYSTFEILFVFTMLGIEKG